MSKKDAQPQTPEARAELHPAEVAKLEAETRKAAAEADAAELVAQRARIDLIKAMRADAAEQASDSNNRVYRFTGAVNGQSVDACIKKLTEWARLEPSCDITLVIASPGGSVFDGMILVDYLRHLSSRGHHITTIAAGMAASMGGIILQAGDTRVCGPESWILIHRISATAGGSTYQLEDEVELLRRLEERVIRLFVTRSGGQLTAARIKKNWLRKDWWLSSDEALALGVVDEVR